MITLASWNEGLRIPFLALQDQERFFAWYQGIIDRCIQNATAKNTIEPLIQEALQHGWGLHAIWMQPARVIQLQTNSTMIRRGMNIPEIPGNGVPCIFARQNGDWASYFLADGTIETWQHSITGWFRSSTDDHSVSNPHQL